MATDPESALRSLSVPVVFFVFNRPELTRKIFAEIRAARPQTLLVVADGPRSGRSDEAELCRQTRQLILHGVDWPCELRTDFASGNLGCGPRIFTGLQWAFTHVEEAIILEDDCLPEPTFFYFCQEMLQRYRHDSAIFMVAGTNFRGACPNHASEYLFSRHCSIWGWATWRRAVADYSLNLDWWRTRVQPSELRQRCSSWHEHRLVCDWLDAQKYGGANTWDIQWFAHVFLQGGLSIVPGTNLISNLGTTGMHANGRTSHHHLTTSPMRFPLRSPEEKRRDHDYDAFLVKRHRPFTGWILGRVAMRAARSPAGPWLRRGWQILKRVTNRGPVLTKS